MSLVSEALRKARAESMAGGAHPHGVVFRTTVVLGARAHCSGGQPSGARESGGGCATGNGRDRRRAAGGARLGASAQ